MRCLPFLFLAACGGADPSPLLDNDASTTSDVVTTPDAPISACAKDAGDCSDPNVPQGWKPVIATTSSTACPTSFDNPTDVVSDPSAGTNACSCACTKTQDPDCQTGSSTWSGIGAACGNGAAALNYAGGNCRPTNGTVDDYDEATKIPPTGGACTVTATPNNGAIAGTALHVCFANGTCQGAVCGGYAPTGFQACIVSDGDVACPAASPFATKHLIDTAPTVQCGDCGTGCTFVGDCTNPTLSFYADQFCQTLVTSIPADGTCNLTGHDNAVVGGLIYSATPAFTGCSATGTSAATLVYKNPKTICCR